ncbi:MAG: excinuclease ABC subunit UvrC [Bacillota bacterium]|nr:excinuclease ABC subunit UvrC [Bacillota bacterium]
MFNIQEALKKAPTQPGVYIMKDIVGDIIYVGKAKNLRNRLRQYFQNTLTNKKVSAMVDHVEEFEYIIVENEVESLILEQNLIKTNMPKYNILLKDDKQFPYIKINIQDRFPKITKTRAPKDDGAIYFGPFSSAISVNESIEFLNKHYKLRTCGLNLNNPNKTYKVCLNYHIGLCDGPCAGLISPEEYRQRINEARDFLEGKKSDLIPNLTKEMYQASEKLDFEKAATCRNTIEFLQNLLTKQSVDTLSFIDKDVIGLAKGEDNACIQIFFVRGGKVLGREHYFINDVGEDDKADILEAFIKQYYMGYSQMPNELIIEESLPDQDLIEEFLSKLKGKTLRIINPQRGENVDLLKLAKKNALDMLLKSSERYTKRNRINQENLENLQRMLDLDHLPERIEAYDISHYAGDQSVGAMVVFENGLSKRSDYRKFKLRENKNNDYKALEEVLTRRFKRLINKTDNKESFHLVPDLIMMDGGKGQVNVGKKVLDQMGLNIPICGLVKDDFHQTRGLIYENVEIDLPVDTNLFRMIYTIQEEAHRFAISYHRNRMSTRFYKSELDNIPGVGPKRKKALIEYFKAIDNIKHSTIEELSQVPGINKKTAQDIYDYFREE